MATLALRQLAAPINLAATTSSTGGNVPSSTTFYIRVSAVSAPDWYWVFQKFRNIKYSVDSPVCSYITVTTGASDDTINITWDAVTPITWADGTTSSVSYFVFITDKDPATYGQTAWEHSYIRSAGRGCGYPSTGTNSFTYDDTAQNCTTQLHFSQRQFTLPDNLDPSYLGEQPVLEIYNNTGTVTVSQVAAAIGSPHCYYDGHNRLSTIASIYYTNSSGLLCLSYLSLQFHRSWVTGDGSPIELYYTKLGSDGFYQNLQCNGHKYKNTLINPWEGTYATASYLTNTSTSLYLNGLSYQQATIHSGASVVRGVNINELMIKGFLRQWWQTGTSGYSSDTGVGWSITNSIIYGWVYADISLPPSYYGLDARTDIVYDSDTFRSTTTCANMYTRAASPGCVKDDCYDQATTVNLFTFKNCNFYTTGTTYWVIGGVENIPKISVSTVYYSEAKYWHFQIVNTVIITVVDDYNNAVPNVDITITDKDGTVYTGTTNSAGQVSLDVQRAITSKYDYATDSLVSQWVDHKGPFTVTATKQGYNKESIALLDISPNNELTLHIKRGKIIVDQEGNL